MRAKENSRAGRGSLLAESDSFVLKDEWKLTWTREKEEMTEEVFWQKAEPESNTMFCAKNYQPFNLLESQVQGKE